MESIRKGPQIEGARRIEVWRKYAQQEDPSDDAQFLEALLLKMPGKRFRRMRGPLGNFGGEIAELHRLTASHDQDKNRPYLETHGSGKNSVTDVVLHEDLLKARQIVRRNLAFAMSYKPGRSFEHAAYVLLGGQIGEGGIWCPEACRLGALRAIKRRGPETLYHDFFKHLVSVDDEEAFTAAQLLTEIHGGSDVYANAVEAWMDDNGDWHIKGEKWICSVVEADVMLVTARVGLTSTDPGHIGLFLVPRTTYRKKDAPRNNFTIRRLKDKIGTKALTTGEIVFHGALAYPIGSLEHGVKIVVLDALNTSRWVNVLGCTAIMRHAYRLAVAWAVSREAFGGRVIDFPRIPRKLAEMKTEWLAALYASMELTALDEKIDTGEADDDEISRYHFLVNALKFTEAEWCMRILNLAVDVIGGNALMRELSPISRFIEDAIVLLTWEGPPNLLASQIHQDMLKRPDMPQAVFSWIRASLAEDSPDPRLQASADWFSEVAVSTEQNVRDALDDPQRGAEAIRDLTVTMVRLVQAACLYTAACKTHKETIRIELTAAMEMLMRCEELGGAHDPLHDDAYTKRLHDVLGTDPDRASKGMGLGEFFWKSA